MPPTKKAGRRTPASASVVPAILADQETFDAALAALARRDRAFSAKVLAAAGTPLLRRREPGFEGLASIIVAQQVSTASANAIFGRLKARFDPLEAGVLLAASDADLRLCGLSAPKMRALRAIAAAIDSDALNLSEMALADAEAAHAALIAVKGIGPWTADVFLLFCLGHADAWPAGDLALQEAARLALGLPARPTTKELIALGERWRPLRGVAAHCLWAYYRATRGRAATLDTVSAPRSAVKRSTKTRSSTKRKI